MKAWKARQEATAPEAGAGLNPRQRGALEYLKGHTHITSGEYAEMAKVNPRTAYRDLQEMVERELLVMHGERKGCRYELRS